MGVLHTTFSTILPQASGHVGVRECVRAYRVQSMKNVSPAQRTRRAFLQLSILVSVVAFFTMGTTVLLDQWIIGHASARFILGTALLIAGGCVGLFAIIAAIGLAVSIMLRDEPAGRRPPRDVPPRLQHDTLATFMGDEFLNQTSASTLAGVQTPERVGN